MVCFWDAGQGTRTVTPHVCLEGTSQSSWARGPGRETQTFLGLHSTGVDTQQKDNWPQLQALPTSSLKINNGRARSHRGVCGRCKQPRNLRCEFVSCCSGSKSRCYEAHAQGTSGAVQINTDGFASCSFMENVEMGTCQAGLLGRLQLLTGRSKRSCRGKCRGGKFRK